MDGVSDGIIVVVNIVGVPVVVCATGGVVGVPVGEFVGAGVGIDAILDFKTRLQYSMSSSMKEPITGAFFCISCDSWLLFEFLIFLLDSTSSIP
jgi:hypothetical protein